MLINPNFFLTLLTFFKKMYIEYLSTKEHWKIAKKYIVKKDYPIEDYPKIKDFAEISFFMFYFNEFTWEQCEERFSHKASLLGRLAETLLSKSQIDEALSIVERHKLLNSDLISDELKEIYQKNQGNFKKIQNKLFNQDVFAPHEVAYNGDNEENYILLKNYGFGEKDVGFFDKDDENLQKAFETLLNSNIVFNLVFFSEFLLFD